MGSSRGGTGRASTGAARPARAARSRPWPQHRLAAAGSANVDAELMRRYADECPECMLGRGIVLAVVEVAIIAAVWVTW